MEKKNRRDFFKMAGVGVLGTLATLFQRHKVYADVPAGVPKGPIKLGIIAFRAGVAGIVGEAGIRAAQIWAEQVNKTGGILGRKVELLIEEEKGAKVTVEKFKKLSIKEKCDAIFGLISTGNGQAVGREAEKIKQLWFSWDGTTQKGLIETLHNPKYAFRSVENEMEAVAGAVSTVRLWPNIKKIAGINNDYSYGRNCWAAYKRVVSFYLPHVEFAEGIFTKLGETDFSATADALMARKPDVIMSSFFSGDNPIILKQLHAKGAWKTIKPCFTTAGYVQDTLKKSFVPEGMIMGYNALYSRYTDAWPLLNEFAKIYTERYKEVVAPECDHAYFTLAAYKAAVEKCYAFLKKWPSKEQIAELSKGLSVPSLSGYRSWREDNKMQCNWFMGVTTHNNPFDYVTVDPIHIIPSVEIQKPVGYTFDQFMEAWGKAVKAKQT